jgi:hypothetical protein
VARQLTTSGIGTAAETAALGAAPVIDSASALLGETIAGNSSYFIGKLVKAISSVISGKVDVAVLYNAVLKYAVNGGSPYRRVIEYVRAYIATFRGSIGRARLCLFVAGFGINGPKTLLAVAMRELVAKDVVGTMGGLLGLVGQFGASVSGVGLGWLLERQGWGSFIHILTVCIGMIPILFLPVVLSPSIAATRSLTHVDLKEKKA